MKRILFIICILIISTTKTTVAESTIYQSTGFFIESKDQGQNLYLDIYTYLNNKNKAISEISKNGLDKTIFVHQSGKGFTLAELKNKPADKDIEYILRQLTKYDFATSYVNFSNGEKIVIIPPTIIGEIQLNPSIYNIPVLPNEFRDVLWREYPEFVHNLSNHWVNKSVTQEQINQEIVNLLEDVKAEALLSSPITEKNFDGIMYRSFLKVIRYERNSDFRNSLFKAYGPQIDYSEKEEKLHPDLIPLSESIKGSILDDYFTLLFDLSNSELYNNNDISEKLIDVLEVDIGKITSISYKVLDKQCNDMSRSDYAIFNTNINNPINYSGLVTHIDGIDIKPDIVVPIIVNSYIKDEITDITSATSDFDPLTRKVKILDENGQVINDIVEEVLVHNITKGTVAKQDLTPTQKISYIYISTQNPKDDFEVYFKTINQKWYKLLLMNYSKGQYLINEYIRKGEVK